MPFVLDGVQIHPREGELSRRTCAGRLKRGCRLLRIVRQPLHAADDHAFADGRGDTAMRFLAKLL